MTTVPTWNSTKSPTCSCRWLKCHWVCKNNGHILYIITIFATSLFLFCVDWAALSPCSIPHSSLSHSLLPPHSSLLNTLHSPYFVFHSPLFISPLCTPAHFTTISDLISTFLAPATPSPTPTTTPHFQPCPVPTSFHTLYGRFTQLQTFTTFHTLYGRFTQMQTFATFHSLW